MVDDVVVYVSLDYDVTMAKYDHVVQYDGHVIQHDDHVVQRLYVFHHVEDDVCELFDDDVCDI